VRRSRPPRPAPRRTACRRAPACPAPPAVSAPRASQRARLGSAGPRLRVVPVRLLARRAPSRVCAPSPRSCARARPAARGRARGRERRRGADSGGRARGRRTRGLPIDRKLRVVCHADVRAQPVPRAAALGSAQQGAGRAGLGDAKELCGNKKTAGARERSNGSNGSGVHRKELLNPPSMSGGGEGPSAAGRRRSPKEISSHASSHPTCRARARAAPRLTRASGGGTGRDSPNWPAALDSCTAEASRATVRPSSSGGEGACGRGTGSCLCLQAVDEEGLRVHERERISQPVENQSTSRESVNLSGPGCIARRYARRNRGVRWRGAARRGARARGGGGGGGGDAAGLRPGRRRRRGGPRRRRSRRRARACRAPRR